MELSWRVERESGVSLVRCRIHNDAAVPCRVRLRNLLDGPVLPPRRRGVPESGWDADGVTLRLEPGERRAVGFACPAPTAEPPVACETEQIADAEADAEPSAATAIRSLGSYRPPRDAVVTDRLRRPREESGTGEDDGQVDKRDEDSVDKEDADQIDADDDLTNGTDDSTTENSDEQSEPDFEQPPTPDSAIESRGSVDARPGLEPIAAWLDAVERRIERGERLTDADVETATDVVRRTGGVGAVSDLAAGLETDADRLRRLERRVSELAARAERADVPVDALRRLS